MPKQRAVKIPKQSRWSSFKQTLSGVKQSIPLFWAAHRQTIINALKALPSIRVAKVLFGCVIHCIMQGALVAGICGFGTIISQGYFGQHVLPGFIKAVGQTVLVGLGTITSALPSLPGFLQFIPNLLSLCWGWPLLMVPVGILAFEIYNKGLPKNWDTIAYVTSLLAPVVAFSLGWIDLSWAFKSGVITGLPWAGVSLFTAVQTQCMDDANNTPAANTNPAATPSKKTHTHKQALTPVKPAADKTYHPRPRHAKNGSGAPITHALNRTKQQPPKPMTRSQVAEQNAAKKTAQTVSQKSKIN